MNKILKDLDCIFSQQANNLKDKEMHVRVEMTGGTKWYVILKATWYLNRSMGETFRKCTVARASTECWRAKISLTVGHLIVFILPIPLDH